MSKPAAIAAACCTLAAIAIPVLADTSHLRAGDKLTYSVSTQSQQQVFVVVKNVERRTQARSSTATGTESIEIASVDPDGTAHGTLTLNLSGYDSNQPLVVRAVAPINVMPDGRIVSAQGVDPLVDQTIALSNEVIRDAATHDLGNTASWYWTLPVAKASVTYTFNTQVRGQTMFEGLPTYAVQTTGAMDNASGDDPPKNTAIVAGTVYYDQHDQLFIGEALRIETSALNPAGETLDSAALVSMALRSFERSPEPSPSPSASSAEEAQATAPPSTPVPLELAPSPLPTVTPSTT